MSTISSHDKYPEHCLPEKDTPHVSRRAVLSQAVGCTVAAGLGLWSADTTKAFFDAERAEHTSLRHLQSGKVGKQVLHFAFTGFDKTADQLQGHLEEVFLPHGDVYIAEFGKNPSVDEAAELCADAVVRHAATRESNEQPNVVMYGQSMGGNPAARVAAKLQDKHGIQIAHWFPDCSPADVSSVRSRESVSFIAEHEAFRYVGPGTRRFIEAGYAASRKQMGPEQLQVSFNTLREPQEGEATRVLKFLAEQTYEAYRNLSEIKDTLSTIPATYFSPEDLTRDRYVRNDVSYEKWRANAPDMALCEIKGGAHCVYSETRAAYAEQIRQIYAEKEIIEQPSVSEDRRAV